MGIDVDLVFYRLKIGAKYLPLFPSLLNHILQYIPSFNGIPLCISRPNIIEPVNNKSSSSSPDFSCIRIHYDSFNIKKLAAILNNLINDFQSKLYAGNK